MCVSTTFPSSQTGNFCRSGSCSNGPEAAGPEQVTASWGCAPLGPLPFFSLPSAPEGRPRVCSPRRLPQVPSSRLSAALSRFPVSPLPMRCARAVCAAGVLTWLPLPVPRHTPLSSSRGPPLPSSGLLPLGGPTRLSPSLSVEPPSTHSSAQVCGLVPREAPSLAVPRGGWQPTAGPASRAQADAGPRRREAPWHCS